MQLPAQHVIEWLVKNGRESTAWDIEGKLPPTIDTDRDRDLLAEHDIDVESLAAYAVRS